MSYKGWMQFGGNEVINVARTMAYVSSMMPKFGLYDTYQSSDLAVAVLDSAYASPLVDEAPWVDPDLPETYGFMGLYPLSITGLDDDTRSATTTNAIGNGGSTTAPRRNVREVRVSGLLIGIDDLSVAAGMSWLKFALNGQDCRDLACTGDDLCFMAATPVYEPLTPYGELVDHRVEWSALRRSGAASWAGGTFTANGPSGLLVGDITPGVPNDTITYVWDLEKPPVLPGGPGTIYPASTLFPGDLVFPGAPVSTLGPGVAVLVGVMDEQGMLATATSTTAEGIISITVDASNSKFVRPVLKLATGLSVHVNSLTARHREIGTVDQCITPLLRYLHDVTCVDGPRITEEYTPSVGAMVRVEFTLNADVPYIYGQTVEVASGDGAELKKALPGADVFPMTTLPACVAEKPPRTVYDPMLPTAPPAPQPPRIDTPILADEFTSYAIAIPGDAVPLWGDTIPIMTLTTGPAKAIAGGPNRKAEARGIRVRMVPRILGDIQAPEDLDPCSACDTFLVSYLPENSTLTIDGVRRRITLTQAGDQVTRAGHLVTDINGGPFRWSTLTCGTAYYALVDVPVASLVATTVSLAPREP